jgi:adenylosuccinate lyase
LDWETVSSDFIEQFELTANPYTTQIEPHDYIAEFCHNLIRINNICIDLSRDIWGYIALDYFKQIPKGHEVGSSTMPHKINPIDFENAEGNFYLANALFDLLANRLPISRWQRDLTDSTLLRNLGVALSHTLIGLKGLLRGLKKLSVNLSALEGDLAQHWEVLSEAIQTVMRAHGIANPYEKLKAFTRGKAIDQTSLAAFIQDLDLPASAKADLLKLTPANYIGLAAKLAKAV